jgi:hypothetical protein
LPDWLNIHNIIIKFKNRLKTGEFFSFLCALFQRRTRVIFSISMAGGNEGISKKHTSLFLKISFIEEYVCDTPSSKTIP